jgi:beta-glucosidase
MSGEASSRAHPVLPGVQMQLADAVLSAGKPVVAVVATGRPLMMTALIERADAVLIAWHLGSEAGNGLADLLTGRTAPSGRLPISWPIELGQVPIYFARRPTGRPADPALHYTSKYLDLPVDPLFPFGHGLGYTRFAWKSVTVSPETAGRDGHFIVAAEIANIGDRAGRETAFLFIRDPVASIARPLLELKDFAQIDIEPGVTATVRFELAVADLAFPGAAPDFAPLLEAGGIEIHVGPNADRTQLLSATVRVTLDSNASLSG